MYKPKISIDLFSSTGVMGRSGEPTLIQIGQVFQGCLLAFEQLGQVVRILEVIRVTFKYPSRDSNLHAYLKVVLAEPGNRDRKFEMSPLDEISVGDYPDAFFVPKQIAHNLIFWIKKTIGYKITSKQNNLEEMKKILSSVSIKE